jgi:hypothetical protein
MAVDCCNLSEMIGLIAHQKPVMYFFESAAREQEWLQVRQAKKADGRKAPAKHQ